MINRAINSHSQTAKSVNRAERSHSQNLFTDLEPVNAQVQKAINKGINSHSQGEPALSAPREGYAPRRGANPAGEGTREAFPSRSDLITAELERRVRREFRDETQAVGGWLLNAFDRAFRNGWLPEAIGTVDGDPYA